MGNYKLTDKAELITIDVKNDAGIWTKELVKAILPFGHRSPLTEAILTDEMAEYYLAKDEFKDCIEKITKKEKEKQTK